MKSSREALQKYPIELRALEKEDGGGWIAEIPSLGPLAFNGWGETVQKALDSLKSVAESLVDDYRKRGVELPDPPPDRLDYSGRLLLRLPRALHARLASEAENEGVSLNTYLISILSDPLQSPRNTRMLESIHQEVRSFCRHSTLSLRQVSIKPSVQIPAAARSCSETINVSASMWQNAAKIEE